MSVKSHSNHLSCCADHTVHANVQECRECVAKTEARLPQQCVSRLDEALSLIALGFKVFPLYGVRRALDGRLVCSCGSPRCQSPGKHPLAVLVPKGLTNATDCKSIVRHWWNQAPSANIGIATGWATVLDVDPRHDGDVSLKALEAEHGALPLTWRTVTGGGGRAHLLPAAQRHGDSQQHRR